MVQADVWQADSMPFRSTQGSRMEDAARTCNKAFSICMSDRNPVIESRRWGSYYLAGLVMKCYFKVLYFSLL
jgi:COP9 signalosome complex subunit 12